MHPGCSYEQWANRVTAGTKPTIYAHVAVERGAHQGLALQYWFFYVFNDFGNTHEGDWEMIQLNFDATDAAQALTKRPTAVGYSQHEGAERADWGAEKLELVDATHPVVYVADGSHANFFDSALFIGRSAEEGVGCDDTRGPHVTEQPVVRTIAEDPAAQRAAYPWIAFEGRWGELQPAFFNGPTGPNMKRQWTEPITWSEGWRSHSSAIPVGGVLGTSATDFFCGAVARGSTLVRRLAASPLVVLAYSCSSPCCSRGSSSGTPWGPGQPLRLGRRRSWRQTVNATWRMYVSRPGLFIGIGLLALPISILITVLQSAIFGASSFLGLSKDGTAAGDRAWFALVIGTLLTLFGFSLVQAATARAMAELDAHRPTGVIHAYRLAFANARPLARTLSIAVPVVTLLTLSVFLIPIAIVLAARWALFVPVAELETRKGLGALHRSAVLARRRVLKVLLLVVGSTVFVLLIGPVIGGLLLLATGASFALINGVAGVIYALTMPLAGITTIYVYYDALTREHLAQLEPDASELPTELGAA